jgi:hypothetical protein
MRGGKEDVRDRQRALRVAAGHERGARRRAHRCGVVAGELHALLRHAIEMRRGIVGTERTDVRVAEIIDVDDDEVRFARGGGVSRCTRRQGVNEGVQCHEGKEKGLGHRHGRRRAMTTHRWHTNFKNGGMTDVIACVGLNSEARGNFGDKGVPDGQLALLLAGTLLPGVYRAAPAARIARTKVIK